MILILEIIFAVAAWRKGWRWRALIPLCVPVVIGFIIGLSVAGSGGSIQELERVMADIQGLAILVDLFCLGSLIVLSVRGPKQKSQMENQNNIVISECSYNDMNEISSKAVEDKQYAHNYHN